MGLARLAVHRVALAVEWLSQPISRFNTGSAARVAGLGFLVFFCWLAALWWFAGGFAGIRVLLSCFTRRPCAGRHLLFFAAAKKSRQKKAAHTASPCIRLRAPNRSYTSHGSISARVR